MMKRGAYQGGIRSVDDIKARCWVDEDTGHWHWRGSLVEGRPSMWISGLQARCTVGVALCFFSTGKRPAKGKVWHHTCSCMECANPEHHKPGNRSSQMLAAHKRRGPLERLKVAKGRRKASRLTDDDVIAIRAGNEPLSVIAAQYGISVSYAWALRRGKRWPLVAVNSSPFLMSALEAA
jgi:hypothetical protein